MGNNFDRTCFRKEKWLSVIVVRDNNTEVAPMFHRHFTMCAANTFVKFSAYERFQCTVFVDRVVERTSRVPVVLPMFAIPCACLKKKLNLSDLVASAS